MKAGYISSRVATTSSKSCGEKVNPREVKNAVYSLDGVQDVAVIGVPDELLGQAIKAFIAQR